MAHIIESDSESQGDHKYRVNWTNFNHVKKLIHRFNKKLIELECGKNVYITHHRGLVEITIIDEYDDDSVLSSHRGPYKKSDSDETFRKVDDCLTAAESNMLKYRQLHIVHIQEDKIDSLTEQLEQSEKLLTTAEQQLKYSELQLKKSDKQLEERAKQLITSTKTCDQLKQQLEESEKSQQQLKQQLDESEKSRKQQFEEFEQSQKQLKQKFEEFEQSQKLLKQQFEELIQLSQQREATNQQQKLEIMERLKLIQ